MIEHDHEYEGEAETDAGEIYGNTEDNGTEQGECQMY